MSRLDLQSAMERIRGPQRISESDHTDEPPKPPEPTDPGTGAPRPRAWSLERRFPLRETSDRSRGSRDGESGAAGGTALDLLACCPRMPTDVMASLLRMRHVRSAAQLLLRLRTAGLANFETVAGSTVGSRSGSAVDLYPAGHVIVSERRTAIPPCTRRPAIWATCPPAGRKAATRHTNAGHRLSIVGLDRARIGQVGPCRCLGAAVDPHDSSARQAALDMYDCLRPRRSFGTTRTASSRVTCFCYPISEPSL